MFKSLGCLGIIFLLCRAAGASPIAIIGGYDGTGAYAAFIDSNTNTLGPSLIGLPSSTGSTIRGVAINDAGQVIVVGQLGFIQPYAAFADQGTGSVGMTISNLQGGGSASLYAAAINHFDQVLIGGNSISPPQIPYAAYVDMNTNAAGPVIANLPSTLVSTQILGVAMNRTGRSIVVGESNGSSYAAFVDPAGNTAGSPVANLPGSGSSLYAVAMNQSGLVLVGGFDPLTSIAYAAWIPPNTNAASAPISSLPLNGGIFAVGINDLGQSIVGGVDGANHAYAAFIDPVTNTVSPISNLPTANASLISGVAINNYGQALIGGSDSAKAYAAFVDPLTKAASAPIASLPLALSSYINAVALVMGSQIPTQGLSGNNLIFADYINQYASQNAFYFIPASLNGELAEALESAAPTRNAAFLFTADNNLFYLNHSLSTHLRNHWHFRNRKMAPPQKVQSGPSQLEPLLSESDVVAGCLPQRRALKGCQSIVNCEEERPYSFWLELIQARAFQDAQLQTPAFNASVGGGVLGFDGRIGEEVQAGLGMAYTFTHIHEKQDSGASDLHQEYAFLYATWSDQQMYVDLACWGGAMQIHQVRNISMTGWNFVSTSSVGGWQLAPHFEAGADYIPNKECLGLLEASAHWSANPFVMLDWISAWQERYEEKGSSPFNVAQKAHYSSFLRMEIGLRFYEPITFQTWRLVFEEKASFVNKTPFGVGKVSAYLVGSPGSFTVETLTQPQNLGAVEFGIIMEPIDHKYPYGSLSYQGEFTTSSQLHQATLELSLDF